VSGPKYVWDLDDVIESDECNTEKSKAIREIEVARCFESVDFVIFGSDLLKEHYKDWYQGKSEVMIDYIDPMDHQATNQKPNDGKIRIGFHGTDYYIKELKDIVPIIDRLKEKYPIEFTVIGVRTAGELLKNHHHIPHIPYDQFNYGLASVGLDIGIAYYKQDKEVNLPKNHLKFSEYAWLGIPCLASQWLLGQFVPKEYYVPFTDLKDFEIKLEQLILNKDRLKIGKKAQKYAKDNFSIEKSVKKYIKIFEGVL